MNSDSCGIYLPTTLENCFLPDFFKCSIRAELLDDEFEIEAREILLADSSAAVILPFPDVPFIEEYLPGDEFFYQLGYGGWNRNGTRLRWTLQAGPVAAEAEALGVTEGVQPVFSEFVQQWNSTTSRFRITERADVNLLVRLVDGSGNVLSESEFSDNLFELPALDSALFSDDDAYEIHVEVYAPWSDQTWSSAGSISWWYNPDTAVSPAELPQELSLRAFPNPFNPRTTVELALPLAGEVCVELFDLTGRSASVIRRGRDGCRSVSHSRGRTEPCQRFVSAARRGARCSRAASAAGAEAAAGEVRHKGGIDENTQHHLAGWSAGNMHQRICPDGHSGRLSASKSA